MTYMVSVLLIVSIFSLLTCNIPNKNFTTSALRVLCYIMTVLFLLGFPLFYFFTFTTTFDQVYNYIALFTLLVLMITAYILCEFFPPLLPIFKSYR